MSPAETVVADQLAHLFNKRETAELLAVEVVEALRDLAISEAVPKRWIQEILGYSPRERSEFIDSILEELDFVPWNTTTVDRERVTCGDCLRELGGADDYDIMDQEERDAWTVDRMRKELPAGYQIVKNGEAPRGWFVVQPGGEGRGYAFSSDGHLLGLADDYELWAKGKKES